MRNTISKITTGVMIAGVAFSLAACKKSGEGANTSDTNMTDMNTMDSSAGMTNDMSATDSMGADTNMGANSAMGGNDMMGGNSADNMSSNSM